jgi:LmbE family N-acetylglucosaminyl deacetylase
MPTELNAAWFLLPHQDDEFAAMHCIEGALSQGLKVRCFFFTQAPDQALNAMRNRESLNVLTQLGVCKDNISFVGMSLGIMDGELQEHLHPLGRWLQGEIEKSKPEKIWIPAWEGGHPDHDALHGVMVETAARANMLDRIQQFPFYNGWHCPGPWFKVMHPLTDNGPIDCQRIRWGQRWRYLLSCFKYPSQIQSWLGLFPFVALHLVFKGVQQTQRVHRERILQRPHSGPLYYEKRGFSTWEKTHGKLAAWIQSL